MPPIPTLCELLVKLALLSVDRVASCYSDAHTCTMQCLSLMFERAILFIPSYYYSELSAGNEEQ